jgi:hypothetical protein
MMTLRPERGPAVGAGADWKALAFVSMHASIQRVLDAQCNRHQGRY